MLDVDRELELIERCTPGPWHACDTGVLNGAVWVVDNTGGDGPRTIFANPPDARFIAHAREGYPESLKKLKRLRELLEFAYPISVGQCSLALKISSEEYQELQSILGTQPPKETT